LPSNEKLELMLNRISAGLNPSDSAFISLIVGLKLSSLIVYAYFIFKLYLQSKARDQLSRQNKEWQKYIVLIHLCYIVCYSIYGFLISNDVNFGVLYHLQVLCMSLMVLFMGYSANVQPHVFSGIFSCDNQHFYKYRNSGLTDSLSSELRENLIRLFDEEKIYRESDISLDMLAVRMNTTRHNTSQVINEHFNLSFHELINKYRIREARFILDTDTRKNLNIIDIAYEVGYNNKVTFNKAFKKDTRLTPSEYQKAYVNSDG
jgi:AraC-like DNA-binding protein